MNNAFVLVMEMTAAKKRTGLATSMEVFWAGGLIAAVPIAYFCRNWRILNIATAVPQFVFYICFLWVNLCIMVPARTKTDLTESYDYIFSFFALAFWLRYYNPTSIYIE